MKWAGLGAGPWYDSPVARIAIDARVITAERDGVGRYARELIPALVAAAPAHHFLILRHPSNRESILPPGAANATEAYASGIVGRMIGHYWRDHRRLRPVFEREGWPDLYHSLFHVCARQLPHAAAGRRPALVVTLHDLIWRDFPFAHGSVTSGIGSWVSARVAIAGTLSRADHVIAVSHATADAARRWLPSDGVTVVHHGIPRPFLLPAPTLPASLAQLQAAGRPWIAALGESKRYKNLALLLHAFALARRAGADATLVLLGRCTSLARTARGLGIEDRVVFAGEVDDETLRAAIGGASLFVHPALVEGFGMPVVEAMALGVPTAVADVPALTEVGGSAVLTFDPHDAGALSRIIGEIVASAALRRTWSQRARGRAACFDWNGSAQATLGVYERVLAARQA